MSDTAGKKIREARKRALMSTADLAAVCAAQGNEHLTDSVLGDIESGRRYKDGTRRRGIELDELYAIAAALKASPLVLLPAEDGPGFLGLMDDSGLDDMITSLESVRSFLRFRREQQES